MFIRGKTTFGNDRVVTDGLVLYLDAANPNSFRGESTENILSTYVDPTFENGTKTDDGWAFDSKTTGTYDYYSEDSYRGIYSIRLQNSITEPIAFWKSNISVVINQKYTISVYSKNLNCPTVPYFSPTGGLSLDSGQVQSFSTINDMWQRFTCTYTATTTGNVQFYIRTAAAATQGYFLIDDIQIEEKPYATPFVNGTRGDSVTTGGGWEDLSGNGNHVTFENNPTFNSDNKGSISFDAVSKRGRIITPFGQNGFTTVCIWYNRVESASADDYRTLFCTPSTNIHHLISHISTKALGIWDGSFKNFGYVPPVDGKFHFYAVVYQSEVDADLYVDGIFYSTVSTVLNLNTSPIGTIGNYGNHGLYYAGNINLPMIYNRALTSAEILQNYNVAKFRYGL